MTALALIGLTEGHKPIPRKIALIETFPDCERASGIALGTLPVGAPTLFSA